MQKVLEILQEAEPKFTGDLQIVLNDLKKHHMEAQDSAKFLSTLERHLKVPVLEKTKFELYLPEFGFSVDVITSHLFFHFLAAIKIYSRVTNYISF